MTDGYLLRALDEREVDRLGRQHEVWASETDQAITLAGFGPGDHLADLGCGPGFLSLELAERVGPRGSVRAIDLSERFLNVLRSEADRRGLSQLRPERGDARTVPLGADSLDGVICRWLLMFLPDPRRVVEQAARALRPGGTFVAMEYAHFRTLSLWPDGRALRRVYDAVHELLARSGGDADVGARVPAFALDAGLEVRDIVPFSRIGRPGSPRWEWLSAVHENQKQLVEAGLITPRELEDFHAEWTRHAADPGAFFTAPPLLVTIARKP